MILPVYLFNYSVLCIGDFSMLILLHHRLNVIIVLIIVDIVLFNVYGFAYGLQLEVDILWDTMETLHRMRLGRKVQHDDLVRRFLRPTRYEFGAFFKTSSTIVLELFGLWADQIGSVVVGLREIV